MMKLLRQRFSATALCILGAACQSPTTPTTYAGEWSGTTAQNRPIAFTVSFAEIVTTITVGHDFNGCSASATFTDLRVNLRLAERQSVAGGPPVPSFNIGFGDPDSPDGPDTRIYVLFPSTARAEGKVNFRNYPGCGSASDVSWTATKR